MSRSERALKTFVYETMVDRLSEIAQTEVEVEPDKAVRKLQVPIKRMVRNGIADEYEISVITAIALSDVNGQFQIGPEERDDDAEA